MSSASGRARVSLLLVSITGILWGTTGVVVQVVAARTGLGAIAIGFYRLAVAAAALLVIGFPALRRILAAFRAAPAGVIATGVGLAAYQGLYFLAVRLSGVSVATVVSLGVAPVLLSVWESIRERRRPSTPTMIAALAAIAGLIMIAGATADAETTEAAVPAEVSSSAGLNAATGVNAAAGTSTPTEVGEATGTNATTGMNGAIGTSTPAGMDGATGASAHVESGGAAGMGGAAGLGLVVAILSGIVYAISTAVSRHTTQGVEPLHLTTLSCVIGASAILPVAAVEGLAFTPSAGPIGLLIYAGAITTALAYALFYMGLRHISGSVAVIVTLLEPLTAALLAVLLIDEPLGVATIIGGVLLLSAVATLYLDAGSSAEQKVREATKGGAETKGQAGRRGQAATQGRSGA
ncbi:DMT family transporter [Actinoplanes sp. G11-F43]|uniref:DMT family transporter n=1 Tax=Actinoplanes sp. G11-F43 TaxID=3424130 RepID=UPI003D34C3EF